MKRTRRIEITTYRRRVTVTEGEPSAIAEERSGGDLILDVLRSVPPMPEEVASNAMVLKDVESEQLPWRLSLSRFGKLLRPRKRKSPHVPKEF